MMLEQDDFDALQAKIEAFHTAETQRHDFVQDLLHKFQKLKTQYQQLSSDYDDSVESRRTWQGKAEAGHPFVLVLIDGDGYVFHDHLLKSGSRGGIEAADLLYTAVEQYVRELDDSANQWSIMVRIYANLGGLDKKCSQLGVVEAPGDVASFVRGFSQHQPLFDFVDAGTGKECADHKIKEMFRLFVNNCQCKHIVFGGCHDNGYVRSLSPYRKESSITLLKATRRGREFMSLPFSTVTFPSVFRSEPLPNEPLPNAKKSPVPQAVPPPASTNGHSLPAAGPQVELEVDPKQSKKKVIQLNSQGQRIDPRLPNYDAKAAVSLDKRAAQQEICADYHLKGVCVASVCMFDHNLLNPQQTLTLRHKMRKKVCSEGSACRSFDCYYGHSCPYSVCYRGLNCQFKALHNLDRNVAKELIKDSSS